MTNSEIEGRLAMLEAITMAAYTTALATALAPWCAGVSPARARQLLDSTRQMIAMRAQDSGLSQEAAAAAVSCGDELLSHVLGNLDAFQPPEGGLPRFSPPQ